MKMDSKEKIEQEIEKEKKYITVEKNRFFVN